MATAMLPMALKFCFFECDAVATINCFWSHLVFVALKFTMNECMESHQCRVMN